MKVTVDLEILANFLSKALGQSMEVAVHDLNDINNSLLILKNGHVTGRKEGMGITDLALEMIKDQSSNPDTPYKVNYESRTLDGRLLRSSTLILQDDDDKPKAILCLNHDDSEFHSLIEHLQQITKIEDHYSRENFSTDVSHLGEKIIADVMASNHKPVSKLNVQEKKQLAAMMVKAGAFEIKGSVEIAAKMLNVSEPTLYRYLKQA